MLMMMRHHFRVTTRATGHRRQVFVHVYGDQEALGRAHARACGVDYDPTTAGGVSISGGWRWPHPDPTPPVVMRLWIGQLTTRTIAHEAVHAAALFHFMDALPGWDSRARTVLLGDNEAMAYATGDIAAEVTRHLTRRLGLEVK